MSSKSIPPVQSRLQKLNRILNIKGVDPKLAQVIMDEIVDGGPSVTFDDIGMLHLYNLSLIVGINEPFPTLFKLQIPQR